jgi:hypothetical protein
LTQGNLRTKIPKEKGTEHTQFPIRIGHLAYKDCKWKEELPYKNYKRQGQLTYTAVNIHSFQLEKGTSTGHTKIPKEKGNLRTKIPNRKGTSEHTQFPIGKGHLAYKDSKRKGQLAYTNSKRIGHFPIGNGHLAYKDSKRKGQLAYKNSKRIGHFACTVSNCKRALGIQRFQKKRALAVQRWPCDS